MNTTFEVFSLTDVNDSVDIIGQYFQCSDTLGETAFNKAWYSKKNEESNFKKLIAISESGFEMEGSGGGIWKYIRRLNKEK